RSAPCRATGFSVQSRWRQGKGRSTVSTPIDEQPSMPSSDQPRVWWRSAVVYQIYPRSFADGSGDGIGDIAGIRSRLRYLSDLGIDALWINPWYPSPMEDAGYDVADFRDV